MGDASNHECWWRVTEWQGLEGTSADHLAQPPAKDLRAVDREDIFMSQ